MICIATFYRFVSLPDYRDLKERLYKKMLDFEIKGTILLASEGINSTISGIEANIDLFENYLLQDKRFKNLKFKKSFYDYHPFGKTKVKLKKEILSLGEPVDVQSKVGKYVSAEEWNNLLESQNIIVIDTRNIYECEIGTFRGALNPQTNNFKELTQFVENNFENLKNKKIAMFCTGGIRCEKFSSYLLQKGISEVYNLKGGILQYLQDIKPEDSLWQGECFVFDERKAIGL